LPYDRDDIADIQEQKEHSAKNREAARGRCSQSTAVHGFFIVTQSEIDGVQDMEAMVLKLLILQNFRRHISTSRTPPDGIKLKDREEYKTKIESWDKMIPIATLYLLSSFAISHRPFPEPYAVR